MRRSLFGLAVVVGGIGAALVLAPPIEGQRASRLERQKVNGRDVVAGEVLVKFREGVGPTELPSIAADTDAQAVHPLGRSGALRLRSRSLSAEALIERLKRRPDVVYAEPNFIVQAITEPNDPRFDQLWGLRNIGQAINGLPGIAGADIRATSAWDLTSGSTATVVAIIDTGIDYTHPDLAPNIWSAPAAYTVNIDGTPITCAAGTHGFNAIARSCDPMDDHDHGTHVSGTIGAAGNNGLGVVGVNWTTRLIGIKFLDANGSGTTADAIAAVEFAIAVKQAFAASGGADIRVLSNSWGGPDFSQALLDEVNAANDANMLLVAGAGNDSFDNDLLPFYPAGFDAPNVVAVAATTRSDGMAWFSNYGRSSVHLGAPGEDILSTTIGNAYAYASGTSMATPHVSGAAALVLSGCDLDTASLRDTLLGSVDPLPGLAGITVSGGRLNVNSALHACTAPPERPTGLTAKGAATKVTLAWSVALGALRYNVKRSQTPGGPYTAVASGLKTTGYADVSVVNGTTYYYVVSAENALGESADSDEASATPNLPPDVVVSSLVSPASAGAGSTVVVTVATKNQGGGRAEPSTTRLYLSDDMLLGSSDLLLSGAQAVPAIAAGATSSASVPVDIPAGTGSGVHYLIARADADGVLSESNENNNSAARQLIVGPDLAIASLSAPPGGAAGGTIAVTDTVKNQGAGEAAGSRTRFYVSTNTILDTGDVLLAESRAVPPLAAGSTSAGTTTLTVPAAMVAGTYYVIAKADGDEVIAEASETNNTSVRAIQIGADLVMSALSAPGNAGAGSTIVVSDTSKNRGEGAAAASVTRFYFSVNTLLDAADALVGSRGVPPLEAGGTSVASTTLTVPAATAPGPYYIVAKADSDGSVPETSETNNTLARAIQIGGDLAVSAFTVPTKAGTDTPFVVSDTTANQGGGAVGPTITQVYLSTNSVLEPGDTPIASRAIPGLAAGAASSGSTTATIPSGTAPGLYFLIAKADADAAVAEAVETNNTSVRSIRVGSDLYVSAISLPATGAAGASIVVSDTTTNQGGGGSPASVTRFYLSANSTLDAGDVRLDGSRAVPGLPAGGSSAGSTSVTIPASTAPGPFYIIAKADDDGAVGETDETNNTRARNVAIGPDLTVSTISVSATSVAAGAAVIVTDSVLNAGAGAAGPSTTRFYLSTNTVIDAGDLALPTGRAVPGIGGGASSLGSTSVTIPAGTAAGSYYLIAKADGDGTVGESVESNNASLARLIQVTSPL